MCAQMYLGIRAGVRQLPHFTPPVAEWAHDRVCVADLLSVTQQRVEYTHSQRPAVTQIQPGRRDAHMRGELLKKARP